MEVFEQVDKDVSGEISVSELADMLLLEDLSEALGDKKPNSQKDCVYLFVLPTLISPRVNK